MRSGSSATLAPTHVGNPSPAAKETSHNLFENVLHFLKSYDEMENMAQQLGVYPALSTRDITVHSVGILEQEKSNQHKPAYQQQAFDGAPVQSLEELYVVAESARPAFREFLNELGRGVRGERGSDNDIVVQLADLKSRKRAKEKAHDDYSKRQPGSCFSWLFDINRASILCKDVSQIEKVVDWLEKNCQIVQAKNRFRSPSSSGYRDFNFHLRLECARKDKHNSSATYFHIVEVQVHHAALKQLDNKLGSHASYEFFRMYFSGADKAVRDLMSKLGALNILRDALKFYLSMHRCEENPEEYDYVADTYSKMGAAVAHLGYYSLATKLLDKARDIFRRVLGPDDQRTVDANRHYAEYLLASDKSRPRDSFEIELEKELELQEGWTPPTLENPKGVPRKQTCCGDAVVDAYFAVDCRRITWLHNLNGRPQLLADLDEICNYINEDALDNPDVTCELREFLNTDYQLFFSDGRARGIKETLDENSRVRLFVWFAKGVDESNTASDKFVADVFGGNDKAVIDVLVVCMEYGAERTAKAIYEAVETRVSRVVWMCMDPYDDNDVVELFTKALLPFCARFLRGKESCAECMKALGNRRHECDCHPPRDSETVLWHSQASKGRASGEPPRVAKLMPSCCTINLFRSHRLRQLKVSAEDLFLLDPNVKGNSLIDQLCKGTNGHRFVFLIPESVTAEKLEWELNSFCTRSRALALYTINEIVSCIQSDYPERKLNGFQNGIFRVGCKGDKLFAEEKLRGKGLHALLWLDFETEEMATLFPNAKATAAWVHGFGDRIVLSLVLSSVREHFGHIEMIREGMEVIEEVGDACVEVHHCKLPRNTIGADIPVAALMGTLKILPLEIQMNNGQERCLLHGFREPGSLAMALEEALFGSHGSHICYVTSLYRDTDDSVFVGVLLRDVKFLTLLRDRGLGGQAAKQLAEILPGFFREIRFDPNSIASLYSSMMLQLETLTDHQQEQLAKCRRDNNVHIKAKAGTGKTFIALNSVLDYLETNTDDSRVLFVCYNTSLAFHFCKWLCNRFQEGRQRARKLKRLFFLTATTGPSVFGMEVDSDTHLLRETKGAYTDSAPLAFGMIVVDEAHDVFRKEHQNKAGRALSQTLFDLLEHNQSTKLLLLSDMSQASVPEDSIEYPRREWSAVELNEVCRSSKRILLGSRSFQLCEDTMIRCAHDSDGLPLRASLFAPQRDESNIYKVYASKICDALEEVTRLFPGLDLHQRLAIIVPDRAFRASLCRGPFLDRLGKSGLIPVSATDASRALTTRKKSANSHIILDAVDEMDGLESLIVFGVGLDLPISDSEAGVRPRVACARFYRAITRTQMFFYLINEDIQGGWLEWLGQLELDENTEPIDLVHESSKLSSAAAVEIVRDDERFPVSDRTRGVHPLSPRTSARGRKTVSWALHPRSPRIAPRGRNTLTWAATNMHPFSPKAAVRGRLTGAATHGSMRNDSGLEKTKTGSMRCSPKGETRLRVGPGIDGRKTPNRIWYTSANGRSGNIREPYFDPRVKRGEDESTSNLTDDDNSERISENKEKYLLEACQQGDKAAAIDLLEQGADINAKDSLGNTPLHLASLAGHTGIVSELLDHEADLHAIDDVHGCTPLHHASMEGHADIVCELLDRGADIHAKGNSGWTPLHWVSIIGYRDIVRILLDRGADIHAKNEDDGKSPLHTASANGHKDVVCELLDRGAGHHDEDKLGWTPLHLASRNGHENVVRELLNHGAESHAKNHEGLTPLHFASLEGHVDIVCKLLDCGADVHSRDNDGNTSLHLAKQKDIVCELLKRGADIGSKNNSSWTPLHFASLEGHKDVVSELLGQQANIHAKDNDGETPLHHASRNGHTIVVRELLDRGADIHARRSNGWTPLHYASIYGHKNVARELLERKADIHAKNDYGDTPLDLARDYDHTDVVEELIEAEAALRTSRMWSK